MFWILSLALQDPPPIVEVEQQPLAANVARLVEALRAMGRPPAFGPDARQADVDPHVLLVVHLNPEGRVKVTRGPAPARLQQHGAVPVLVKIINDCVSTERLRIRSPQAGPAYAGVADLSIKRQEMEHLRPDGSPAGRFLQVEISARPPMSDRLSGLKVQYALALISSSEAGKREATIAFDAGQGNQDLGFRGEVAVLFDVAPAVSVKLFIREQDRTPTAARLVFKDALGNVYPPQARRVAPDFFFQEQIYRNHGDTVLLPPGDFTMESSRGPEYHVGEAHVTVKEGAALDIKLERWIHPAARGFYSGDHHIHAAGCAHYTDPTQGVAPTDMFVQVKGEGLNVGSVLNWQPCFSHQRRFMAPHPDPISEPLTLLKYDLEISGFGSQALGHVCLLNLKDPVYPGSDGTETKGWPTWTTPAMRWAKAQGAVTGYAHSASGLEVDAPTIAKRLLSEGDAAFLPEPFGHIDVDGDGKLAESELRASLERAATRLPNFAVPEMNGVGAQEICVSTAEGVCDFISAMDTPRIAEWNCWYHILNSGFPLKVSGETDFPCMSGTRVGQGRVYVRLGKIEKLDYGAWCEGLARGRSYVSDGYAHALDFAVEGTRPGEGDVARAGRGKVAVSAVVAFAPRTPAGVPYAAKGDLKWAGDTVLRRGSPRDQWIEGGTRKVEIVLNGRAVASAEVPADGKPHPLEFAVPVERSSWIALRHFPQLHTNPVNVIVGGSPIRASRRSALWCAAVIEQLWRARGRFIAEAERAGAETTFKKAIETYRRIAAGAPDGT